MKVEKVETEEEIARRHGMGYFRIAVLDRHRPTDQQVDDLLNFVNGLPENSWLHIHCRAGRGRTTTFLVLYDIIKNSHKVKLEDIIQRQAILGSKNLYIGPGEKSWKYPFYLERVRFLKAFYRYANDPNGLGKQSWSTWTEKNFNDELMHKS